MNETDANIEKGLADIEVGRFSEFTPEYAKELQSKFRERNQESTK